MIRVDATLDVRGESCPYPELYTLEALAGMRAGEVLEVLCDCAQAFVNVPIAVQRHRYRLLEQPSMDGAEFALYIEVPRPSAGKY